LLPQWSRRSMMQPGCGSMNSHWSQREYCRG